MSAKKLKITVNDKSYEVEVGDLSASPLTVTVNGKPYEVEFSLTEPERSREPAAQPSVAASVAAPPSAPAKISPTTVRAKAVTAPMPGHIAEIFVQPGDQVSAGQQLCLLEAMKMKNAIRSPRDGVVETVPVSPGQKVAHGEPLVTFE